MDGHSRVGVNLTTSHWLQLKEIRMAQIGIVSFIVTLMIGTVITNWDQIMANHDMKIAILFWSPFLILSTLAYVIYLIVDFIKERKVRKLKKEILRNLNL